MQSSIFVCAQGRAKWAEPISLKLLNKSITFIPWTYSLRRGVKFIKASLVSSNDSCYDLNLNFKSNY